TDCTVASRVMEEEWIYDFVEHASDGRKMVVKDSGHTDLPVENKLIFEDLEGGGRETGRIFRWEKIQELRSGKYTLWDHCFELPHKHLEASKSITPSVQVGEVTHKLQVSNNGQLEIRDFPGGYAQRFDGVPKGGGEQPAEIQKIFDDNKRTVALRMEEEGVLSLVIQGTGTCRNFIA